LTVASEFDISREAAARRYVELHSDNLAVVFCKDSRFLYSDNGRDFPRLSLRRDHECDVGQFRQGTVSDFEEVASEDWLVPDDRAVELSAQTLWQVGGHSMTLLRAILPDDEDDPGFDDSFERFTRTHRQ
jgi:hypothetical protein